MSVPHLDARIIDGEAALLFRPFASITSKFLKQGSVFDLFGSLKGNNLKAMLSVGLNNFDLAASSRIDRAFMASDTLP